MPGPSNKKKKGFSELVDQSLEGLNDEEKKSFQMMAVQSGFRPAAVSSGASKSQSEDEDELDQVIEDLKTAKKELEKARKEIDKLSKDLDKQREAAEKYKPYKERFEKKNEEHKAARADCERLKKDNSALRQANESLSKENKSLSRPQDETPSIARKDLEKARKENDKLSSEIDGLRDENSHLKSENLDLRERLDEAAGKIGALEAEMDSRSGKKDLVGTVSRPEPAVLESDLFTRPRYKAVISIDGTKMTFTPDIRGGAVCSEGKIRLPKLESYLDFHGPADYKAYSADGDAITIWIE